MRHLGTLLPSLVAPPPGPASRALAARLRACESRNVTYLAEDFPVFWSQARGSNVRDADGNVYVDLTSAFGVALAGHAAPPVVAAVEAQAARLLHAMGDVHPPEIKVELLERLGGLAPWPKGRTVLASTGSEAVEIALKTAALATGRPGILAFEGGYHGLTLGALAATHRPLFREPFRERLYEGVVWAPFPEVGSDGGRGADARDPWRRTLERVDELLAEGAPGGDAIGTVLLEPVQGRAGVRVFPPEFLASLGEVTRSGGALLVADEVFTGMGRCGAPLASTRLGLSPDVVCLGKALGGGLPVSACLGRQEVMAAWPESRGEAVHTSTFLGHPLACAAALAMLDLLDGGLADEAERVGARLLDLLREELAPVPGVVDVRGVGALLGVELAGAPGVAARVAVEALCRGVLVLPAGEAGNIVEIAPPVTLTDEQARVAVRELGASMREAAG